MSDQTCCLQVKALSIDIKQRESFTRVVNSVSFACYRGQCLGLVGESGSGKSMIAHAIMQLLPPSAYVDKSSQILFSQADLLNCSQLQMRKIRGAKIAMIFQDASTALNPVKTIGQQLLDVLLLHQRISSRHARTQALSLLSEVGLDQPQRCLAAYPHELSGGMRQRAMIAMALACRPTLLIADEPTTALDVTVQAQIIQLLKDLQSKYQMGLIFISHDLAVVSQLAQDVLVLKQGTVQEHTSAEQFFQSPTHPYSKQLLQAIPELEPQRSASVAAPLLQVEQLQVYFPIKKGLLRRTVDYVRAVESVSFRVNKGQTLAIVGESGSGKTTVAKALVRLIKQRAGQVSLMQDNVSSSTPWSSQVQMVFQDPHAALNPRMRVLDCLMEGVLVKHSKMKHAEQVAFAQELLQQVHLPTDAMWAFPHEFSGGERQRLCIARALAVQPACLILDEPTSSLDVSIQQQILSLLMEIQQQHGLSYILITHHLSVVATLAHSVMVMHQGVCVEQGTTSQVLLQPQHRYTQKLLSAVPKRPHHSDHHSEISSS